MQMNFWFLTHSNNTIVQEVEMLLDYFLWLLQGDDSTDENDVLNDFPDDDQYDTEDSFIDDRELVHKCFSIHALILVSSPFIM